MRNVTWPMAAIVIAGVGGIVAVFVLGDSQARSAVVGLLIVLTGGLSAVYTRKSQEVGTEQLKSLVRAEIARVRHQVNGRMSELISKIPDAEQPPAEQQQP